MNKEFTKLVVGEVAHTFLPGEKETVSFIIPPEVEDVEQYIEAQLEVAGVVRTEGTETEESTNDTEDGIVCNILFTWRRK